MAKTEFDTGMSQKDRDRANKAYGKNMRDYLVGCYADNHGTCAKCGHAIPAAETYCPFCKLPEIPTCQ